MKRRHFLTGGLAASGLVLGATQVRVAMAATTTGASADNFEHVAQLVIERMEADNVPGVALGVLKDGVMQLRGFGVTSIENPLPVDENTIFEIASLSKTVTATAVMRLVEEGALDLDAPVRQYLPDWRVADEATSERLLVRHLLTHTTGLNGPASTQDLGVETLERFAQSMDRLVSVAPPGEQWSYLNPGYALLGRLIEVATGNDIHTAFNELVFEPLGLERASTRLDQIATHRLALGHRPGDDGSLSIVRPYSMGSSIPAGGVNMSIDNLMRYAAFHLGEGESEVGDVLSLEARQLMREPQAGKSGTDDAMSLAWHLRTLDGVTTAAHGGSAGAGHRLLLELVPERRLAFAILTNHTEGWRLAQIVEHAILETYEGLALEPNQKIAYRGANEDFSLHATPLDPQPDPAEYAGTYLRGESTPIELRAEGGLTMVGETTLHFFGPDVAYSSSNGTPTEFIRNEAGEVTWIRQNGQGFARKEGM